MTRKSKPTPPPSDLHWRKSCYSADQTACVEVADLDTGAAIRDTKHLELGALFFGTSEWRGFLSAAKDDLR